MPKAFVLMKAMPPTTGHLQLIQFADELVSEGLNIVVDTDPSEPMIFDRVCALDEAVSHARLRNEANVHHLDIDEREPGSEGFWQFWRGVLIGMGFTEGDLIVGSESYCAELATWVKGVYVPYDPYRQINAAKATKIRERPYYYWDHILPEFRHHLQFRVTIFGAESTGKTTLASALAVKHDSYFIPEYARPYLENTANVITKASMEAIWHGQAALQRLPLLNSSLIVQDTDLFSTVGYWERWQYGPGPWKTPEGTFRGDIGTRPWELLTEAQDLKSDLYLLTPSNIPFEPDPLRYGGDKREIEDRHWANLCVRTGLNWAWLDCDPNPDARLNQATKLIDAAMQEKAKKIAYERPYQ